MGILEFNKFGNNTSIDEMVLNWSSSGLLHGLNKTMQKKVAIALEKCAAIILTTNKYEGVEWPFETFIFPVIRRSMFDIYKQKPTAFYRCNRSITKEVKKRLLNNFDVEFICTMLHENYFELYKYYNTFFEKYLKGHQIDIEAEVVVELTRIITQILCVQMIEQVQSEQKDTNS